jgi:gamma-glutamyltranspeptidase/glutathione hydrolase
MKRVNKKFMMVIPIAIALFTASNSGVFATEKTRLELLEPFKTYGRVANKQTIEAMRPLIMGTHGVVSTGHYRATQVGMDVLKKGGNAFDAGIAAAMALKSMKMCIAGWTGVAPLVLYSAREGLVTTRIGVGPAPAKATLDYFIEHLPRAWSNPYNAIIPADVDTWCATLARFGTISFEEAAQYTIEIAEEGYHLYKLQLGYMGSSFDVTKDWPYNQEFWWQHGEGNQKVGDPMVNKDLGKLVRYMVDAERRALAAGGTRSDGIWAARDAFYKGEPAKAVDKFYKEHLDGFITYEDMATFTDEWMKPIHTNYRGYDVYGSQVTQGGLMILMLNMLENFDLKALGYNTPEYVHLINQVTNLAFSDRYRYMGDPDFVDVPKALYSKEYARERIKLIDMKKAFEDMPPWGDPRNMKNIDPDSPTVFIEYPHARAENLKKSELKLAHTGSSADVMDPNTTSLNVMDAAGNLFSMTESDVQLGSPWIPDWGFGIGARGLRFQIDPASGGVVAPHKRPRCTNIPYIVMKDGHPFMGLSTPGGDTQSTALLQIFLNVTEWGMDPQQAIDQPRFRTLNQVASNGEINGNPGVMGMEDRFPEETFKALEKLGHTVKHDGLWSSSHNGATVTYRDPETGLLVGAADVRREAYADGW